MRPFATAAIAALGACALEGCAGQIRMSDTPLPSASMTLNIDADDLEATCLVLFDNLMQTAALIADGYIVSGHAVPAEH